MATIMVNGTPTEARPGQEAGLSTRTARTKSTVLALYENRAEAQGALSQGSVRSYVHVCCLLAGYHESMVDWRPAGTPPPAYDAGHEHISLAGGEAEQ
jgi:hypothetical protein